MPKMKTHKSVARRLHVTGTGKLMRTRGGKSHLRRKKPLRVKRQYDETHEVAKCDVKRIKRLLPYGI